MRYFLTLIIFLIITLYGQDNHGKKTMAKKIIKSESEWATCLNPDEYRVLREKGTEMAFTGKYYKHKDNGTYVCAACDYELFGSNTKYDSGTGWPSFYAAIDKDRILEKRDNTLGMVRTEILCTRCESHLGHLFLDGPKPSGLRYCVNSIALDFKKAE